MSVRRPLLWRSHFLAFIVFAFVAMASLPADAHTITMIPASPDASTPITLRVWGTSPVSQPIYLRTYSIIGQIVHVEGCVPPGFTTPSSYSFLVNIGPLSPGSYTVEYYTASCGVSGNPHSPFVLRTTLDFAVSSTVSAVPTLQTGTLGVLAVLVALGAVFLHRQRTRG
jgi:hypothetical protein